MIVVLMLTTVPDAATATALADGALDARLAACVSELGAIRSRYHWQGKVETADEIQLLFKTSPCGRSNWSDLFSRIILTRRPKSSRGRRRHRPRTVSG